MTDNSKRIELRLNQWRLWAIYISAPNEITREMMLELTDRELRLILSTMMQKEAA